MFVTWGFAVAQSVPGSAVAGSAGGSRLIIPDNAKIFYEITEAFELFKKSGFPDRKKGKMDQYCKGVVLARIVSAVLYERQECFVKSCLFR